MAEKPDKSNKLKARLPRGLADRGVAEIAATRRMVEQIRTAVARESTEQNAQFKTADFREGVAAYAARREPVFKGE